jgi:hypothetical protein
MNSMPTLPHPGAPLSTFLQVRGAARYPVLWLEAPQVDLGEVVVRSSGHVALAIANRSDVPACFSLHLQDADGRGSAPSPFRISPTQ